MKLKFYGTGGGEGIPGIFCSCRVCEYARQHRGKDLRTRTQAVIDDCLGLEFPTDTFAHHAYGGLDMRKVRHILITHAHSDHFLPSEAFGRPQGIEDVHFYTSEETGREIRAINEKHQRAYSDGSRKKTVEFEVVQHNIEHYKTYDIIGYQVTPVRARHHENLGSALYIIRKDGKSIFWGFDTGRFHEDVFDYIQSSGDQFDIVVLDCTLKENEQITTSHMDLTWCNEMKERLREIGAVTEKTRLMISHIGHLVDMTHEELSARAAKFGFEVAYDGLEVEI